MREIIVEIDEEGKATVKTQGFQGPSCVEAVKQLMARLRALGVDVDVEKQTPTPEYYRVQQTTRAHVKET